jgi:hypothetical protein
MKIHFWPCLVVCGWLAACGMRTPFDPSTASGQPSPGTVLQPDANLPPDTRIAPPPEAPRPADAGLDRPVDRIGIETAPPDGRPDLKVDFPDVTVDLGSDRRPNAPDLRPNPDGLRPDLRPDTSPEVAVPPGSCTVGSLSPCACDHGPDGLRFCLPSLVFGECMCGMDASTRVKLGMLGDWSGTATNPWSGTYPVLFTFDNTYHYSCRSLDPKWTALYYGTDEDSPNKTYSTGGVNLDGSVGGTITIVFEAGNTVENKLDNISVSSDLKHLTFSFKHFGDYGPLQYDLQRVHW